MEQENLDSQWIASCITVWSRHVVDNSLKEVVSIIHMIIKRMRYSCNNFAFTRHCHCVKLPLNQLVLWPSTCLTVFKHHLWSMYSWLSPNYYRSVISMCHKDEKANCDNVQDDDIDIREITATVVSEALAQVVRE